MSYHMEHFLDHFFLKLAFYLYYTPWSRFMFVSSNDLYFQYAFVQWDLIMLVFILCSFL